MNFLTSVEKLLDLPPIKKTQVIKELKSHCLDIEEELKGSGKSPDQIENEIQERLGSPKDIAARMNTVHNSASWKSALIAIVPFFGLLIAFIKTHQTEFFGVGNLIHITFFLVLLVGSARELIRGRRPIWLATWLAGVYYYGSMLQINIIMITFNNSEAFKLLSTTIDIIIILTYVYGASRISRWKASSLIMVISQIMLYLVLSYLCNPSTNTSLTDLGFICSQILSLILILRFALAVFALHDYGSSSQSLLFLFTSVMLSDHTLPNVTSIYALNIYTLVGFIAAVSVAVIIYTKITEWKHKILIVAISLIPLWFLKGISSYNSDVSLKFIFMVFIQSIVFCVLYCVPLVIYENIRCKKPREVLDSMVSV